MKDNTFLRDLMIAAAALTSSYAIALMTGAKKIDVTHGRKLDKTTISLEQAQANAEHSEIQGKDLITREAVRRALRTAEIQMENESQAKIEAEMNPICEECEMMLEEARQAEREAEFRLNMHTIPARHFDRGSVADQMMAEDPMTQAYYDDLAKCQKTRKIAELNRSECARKFREYQSNVRVRQ